MSYSDDELWELYHQAYGMPYGPGQIALLEQVIARADAQGLNSLGFAARMEATYSYVHIGEPTRALVTFAWCLAEFDRDPVAHRASQGSLLWQFRYALKTVTQTPEVPLDRANALLDDMQRRFVETGHSLQTVWSHRHRLARHVGDIDTAQEYYLRWCAAPRDDLSDCAGCDPTAKAYWLATVGQDEQAIAMAEPDPDGHRTCGKQPQRALTMLMVPYLRTGRLEQARDAHRRAYRLHRTDLADLEEIAEHIGFCARTGNEVRALEMVERHLGWLERAPSPWAAMVFAACSALALRRAQALSPAELTLRTPEKTGRTAQRSSALDLAGRLAAEATTIAERFDRRNGTDRVGAQVRDMLTAEPLIDHLPLSPTASRAVAVAVSAAPSTVVTTVAAPPAPDAGVDELVEAVADRTAHGDHAAAADLRHRLAAAYRDIGRLLDAAEVAEEELAHRLGTEQDARRVRSLLATIYERLGQPEEALTQLDAIVDERARADDWTGVARGAKSAGKLLRRLGQEEQAADRLLVAAQAYARLGRAVPELRSRRRRAWLLLWADGPEPAIAALREADELSRRLDDGTPEDGLARERMRLNRVGAVILWHAGDHDAAAARAELAADIAAALGKDKAREKALRLRQQILDER